MKTVFQEMLQELAIGGTGDVEVSLKNDNDLEKVKPLIERAYNEN